MVDRGQFNDMSRLSHLDSRIRSQAPLSKKTPMPHGFQPDSFTVLCGRGKNCFNHAGNKRFRNLCELKADIYGESKSKIEKSVIVMSIVDAVREGSASGGFVKMDSKTKQWYEVGDEVAREKVGQQLRDCLKAKGHQSRICIKKKASLSPRTPVTAEPPTQSEEVLSLPLETVDTMESQDSHKCAPTVSLPTITAASSRKAEMLYSSSSASVVTKSTAFSDETHSPTGYDGNASLNNDRCNCTWGAETFPFPPSLVAVMSTELQNSSIDEPFLLPPSLVAVTSTELQTARMSSLHEEYGEASYADKNFNCTATKTLQSDEGMGEASCLLCREL